MLYGDFMAFPIPQHELITKSGVLTVSPDIVLNLCQTTSVPPFVKDAEKMLEEHHWFRDVIEKRNQAPFKAYYGVQHPPIDGSARNIARLREAGVKFMTLAYDFANPFGGGFAAPEEHLTGHGEALLWMMADNRIALDLSHAGHQTARDALVYIEHHHLPLRIVASHVGCYSIYGHLRNLPDDVLLGIMKRGGIVGLVTATWMLSATSNTLAPFGKHLAYLVGLMGTEHVALGTDGVYQTLDLEEEARRFAIMREKVDPQGIFKARSPDQPPELNSPQRLTVIERFIREHLGDYLSAQEVQGVMGGNLSRFFSTL